MSQQQTLQQLRAAQAFADVNTIFTDQGWSDKKKKEYGSLLRGLPALIQSDGLATTLAFLLAKAKGKDKSEDRHAAAYDHLSKWILGRLAGSDDKDLLAWLLDKKVNSFIYRQAMTEALAYLNWLKRFAEAKGIGDEQG